MLLSLELRGLVEVLRNVENCYRNRRISVKIETHETIVPGEKGCKGSCFLAAGNWWKSNQTVVIRLLCKAVMKGPLTYDCNTAYFVGQVWRKDTILENIFFLCSVGFLFFTLPFCLAWNLTPWNEFPKLLTALACVLRNLFPKVPALWFSQRQIDRVHFRQENKARRASKTTRGEGHLATSLKPEFSSGYPQGGRREAIPSSSLPSLNEYTPKISTCNMKKKDHEENIFKWRIKK